jgi:hypothetical protein
MSAGGPSCSMLVRNTTKSIAILLCLAQDVLCCGLLVLPAGHAHIRPPPPHHLAAFPAALSSPPAPLG